MVFRIKREMRVSSDRLYVVNDKPACRAISRRPTATLAPPTVTLQSDKARFFPLPGSVERFGVNLHGGIWLDLDLCARSLPSVKLSAGCRI